MALTAEQVKVWDNLRSLYIKSPSLADGDAANVPQKLTEADLRGLIKTDAYQDPSHPEHHKVMKEVTEGYEKLYGKKSG